MEGMEFRTSRVYDEAVKQWREATERDKETVPNAYVLLYAWKIHFEPNNAITSKNILNIDALKRHCNRFRSDAITVSAVKYFAELECFLLKHMPENEYTKYIVQVKEQIEAYDNGSFGLEDIVPAHIADEDLPGGVSRQYLGGFVEKDCWQGSGGSGWGRGSGFVVDPHCPCVRCSSVSQRVV